MAPGVWDKFTRKLKKKLGSSNSKDEPALKRPSPAQPTTPARATSSTPTTSTTTTTVTGVIAQPEPTSTAKLTASSTSNPPTPPAVPTAPSVSPTSTQPTESSTAAQPMASSTTQPAAPSTTQLTASTTPLPYSSIVEPTASQSTQPSTTSIAQLPASPAPQPVTSPPTQSTTSPAPPTIATPTIANPTTAIPTTSDNLPEELWKKAYEALKAENPARVRAYEEILFRFQENWVQTGTSPAVPDLEHCKLDKSAEMWKLVYAGLERSKKQAEVKEAVADVLETVDKIKGIVDKAVKYSPEASTIWAGASLGLEILANPVTEPGINRKGIAYVLSRMEWYWNLADVVLDKEIASSSSTNLRENLQKHVVNLYKKLLLFQMRSVCLYDRNGISVALRDAIKLDDWTDKIKEVKDAETLVQKELDQFTHQDMRVKLKEIRDAAWAQEQLFRQEVQRLQKREQDKDDQKCLEDLLLNDPRKDKERIQETRGIPLWDSYHWILEHPEYENFTNDSSSRVLWSKGDPGKGKTMLLCGIIDHLDKSTDPLFYFFCEATTDPPSSDTAVMRGLIYTVLDHYPSLMPKLRVEYDKKKDKLFKGLDTSLILKGVLTSMLKDPILEDAVFVIDSLDECITDRPTLIKLIVHLSSSCQPKWIVSSRGWPEIQEEIDGIQGLVSITLEKNEEKVAAAVQSYVRTRVDELAKKWNKNNKNDNRNNEKDEIEDLKKRVYDYMVSHAEDTFLWVALVCKRLAESDVAKRRVEEELKKFPKGLDDLYKLMMDRILASSESDRLKAVLAAACLAYGPLKSKDMIDFVDSMAGYDETDVKDTIDSCGSFLTYQDGAVYFVHQSAKEYLVSKAGVSHIFPQGIEQQHSQMALRCLEVLQDGLKKENIYGLSSYGTLIGEFTRPSPDPLSPLEYSCLHWADHLVNSGACSKDINVFNKVFRLLQDKFTYWLEALSLLGQLAVAVQAIAGIESALRDIEAKDVLEFLQDARRFVRYHKAGIEIAPRQVYASALVFSPRCSKVRQQFKTQVPKWIVSEPEMQDGWDTCIQTISTVSFDATAGGFACSPDGRLFAATAKDGHEVKFYETASGESVYTLSFHDPMVSVAFSPCSRMLAAARIDEVRIIQVDTFECIQTFKDSSIQSVLFSPNGKQTKLAMVLFNGVRIRNWKTGDITHDLRNRRDYVTSAAFLSDNKFATGYFDGTVNVWDLATSTCEQTLGGSGSKVFLVASSPDGKRLATASDNFTAKIWHQEADTGEWVCSGPFPREQGMLAVAFSADGKTLITGSTDGKIRLWDEAGVCVKTLHGHGSGLIHLSVIPVGQQLLTASFAHQTIKLWDISTGPTELPREGQPPSSEKIHADSVKGYINRIVNVVFSPDGQMLVAHADDGETKIWNVGKGRCVQAREISGSHEPLFETPTIASAWIDCLAGDERAVMRNTAGEIAVWDMVASKRLGLTNEKIWLKVHSKQFGDDVLTFSPDGKFYAVSSYFGLTGVYHAPTGECVYERHGFHAMKPLAISPDTRELFAYRGSKVYRKKLDNDSVRRLDPSPAWNSTANFYLNTQFGKLEISGPADEDVKLVGWGLRFERDWILRGTERMLFIPTEHRKLIMDAIRRRFAIICPSGRIMTMTMEVA